MPVVLTAPSIVVVPPPWVVRFRRPAKVPSITVVPLKSSTRLLPPPVTLEAKVPVSPLSVTVGAANCTAPP